jgi:hypothetical protein
MLALKERGQWEKRVGANVKTRTETTDGNAVDATVLVFQYGSNCTESQINNKDRLKGDAKFVCVAETVEDYEIAFDVFSNTRNCAAADIIRKPGGKVWGALYEIPGYLIHEETAKARNRKSLERIEGKNYEGRPIQVQTPDGGIVTALTYTVIDPQAGRKTGSDYVRYIITGLRERGIPVEYIEKVKRIAGLNNPDIATEIEGL